MTTAPSDNRHSGLAWRCPVDPTAYDRTPALSPGEQLALAEVRARRAGAPARKRWPLAHHRALSRLLGPLEDVLVVTGAAGTQRSLVADPPAEAAAEGVPPAWLARCRRWRDHSGFARKTRQGHYYNLLVTGRVNISSLKHPITLSV